jgi:hypothetical protein
MLLENKLEMGGGGKQIKYFENFGSFELRKLRKFREKVHTDRGYSLCDAIYEIYDLVPR